MGISCYPACRTGPTPNVGNSTRALHFVDAQRVHEPPVHNQSVSWQTAAGIGGQAPLVAIDALAPPALQFEIESDLQVSRLGSPRPARAHSGHEPLPPSVTSPGKGRTHPCDREVSRIGRQLVYERLSGILQTGEVAPDVG